MSKKTLEWYEVGVDEISKGAKFLGEIKNMVRYNGPKRSGCERFELALYEVPVSKKKTKRKQRPMPVDEILNNIDRGYYN